MTARKLSWHHLALLITMCAGCWRIIATYPALSHTYDEPFHLQCGLEFLERGTYSTEALHPPLGRLAAAALPYQRGVRISNDSSYSEQRLIYKDAIHLYDYRNEYSKNLSASRMGVLPFFLLALLSLYMLGAMFHSRTAGLLAAIIYSLLPLVTAHSGLATTDIPATACLLVALTSAVNAQRRRTLLSWCIAGAAAGLALSAKNTNLVFGILLVGIWLAFAVVRAVRSSPHNNIFRTLRASRQSIPSLNILAAMATTFIMLWLVYGFETGRIGNHKERMGKYEDTYSKIERSVSQPVVRSIMLHIASVPVPMPSYWVGLLTTFGTASQIRSPYFLGSSPARADERWMFFPLLYIAKHPLSFHILFAAAIVYFYRRTRQPVMLVLLVWFVVCMVFSSLSNTQLGLRHTLPFLFVPVIFIALMLARLFEEKHRIISASAGVLMCLLVAESISAHPAYLSWFNVIAEPYRIRITVDSDTDWQQDIRAAVETLKSGNYTPAYIEAFAPPASWGVDSTRITFSEFNPQSKPDVRHRYLALGYFSLMTNPAYIQYRTATPVAEVGRSVVLFRRVDEARQ